MIGCTASVVAIKTSLTEEKVLVLSIADNSIVFPSININQNETVIETELVGLLRQHMLFNDLFLIPQIVSAKKIIDDNNNIVLQIVYGLLVEEKTELSGAYWQEIDFLNPAKDKNLNTVFEVIQKLT